LEYRNKRKVLTINLKKNEILALFRKELPEILIGDGAALGNLEDEDNHLIFRMENDELIGISVINGNSIYLLLVNEFYQREGIGTELLKESEEYIKAKGFDKVKLGVGKDYIIPGVPMNRNAHKFFEKHGYIHSWGDVSCIDLSISLSDFIYNEYNIGDTVAGVLYRFATLDDVDGIKSCCEEDAGDFIELYSNEDMYKPNSSDPVIVAEKDGEILAALMIGTESEEYGIGYAGCIVTAPRHRNKGIATNLLKIGTTRMKNMGLKTVWLSYTYTAIENTYKKLGFKVCMEYFMGEKNI